MNDKLSNGDNSPIHSKRITNVPRQDAAEGRITPVTNQETKHIIDNSITQSSQLKRSQSSSSQSKNE